MEEAKRNNTQARTVVTVLGTNYCGSHYLALMLGSHSRAAHVGELKHLRRPMDHRKRSNFCHVCGAPENCPVLQGIAPESIDRAYDTIFENLAHTNSSHLIDNSKSVRWAGRFLGYSGARMKYIHLIRDPRALVRRGLLADDTRRARLRTRLKTARRSGLGSPRLLAASSHEVYRRAWLQHNQAITRFLEKNHLDHLLVPYRNLALHPDEELQRINEWLGLPHEPAQAAYWRFEHHGDQKPQYEWVKQQQTRYLDTRWKEDLPVAAQARTTQDPRIRAYLARRGLRCGSEGLERVVATGPPGAATAAPS